MFGGMEVVEGEGCVSSVLTKSKEGMQYNEFTKPKVGKQIILSNQIKNPTIGNQCQPSSRFKLLTQSVRS